MSKEVFPELPDVAKEHIRSIPDERLAKEVGEELLRLSHKDLHEAHQEKPGPDYANPIERDRALETQGHHVDRVERIMNRISELTSKVHSELSNKSEYQLRKDDVFNEVTHKLLEQAMQEKESGDIRASIESMQVLAVVSAMKGGPDEQLTLDIVKHGMAPHLVTALNESHGLVLVHHGNEFDGWNDYSEPRASTMYASFRGSKPLLQLASGLEISDDYTEFRAIGASQESAELRLALLEELGSSELLALAYDAHNNKHNADGALHYAELAIHGYEHRVNYTANAKAIRDYIEIATKLGPQSPEYQEKIGAMNKTLLMLRNPNSHYRNNSPIAGAIDRAIVLQIAHGDIDSIRDLVSAASLDANPETWEWDTQDIDPENAAKTIDVLVAMSTEKAEEVCKYLEAQGVTTLDQKRIIEQLPLPDQVLDVPQEFWALAEKVFGELYSGFDDELRGQTVFAQHKDYKGIEYSQEELLGSRAPIQFAEHAKLVLLADANGMDLRSFADYDLLKLPPAERDKLIASRIDLFHKSKELIERMNRDSGRVFVLTFEDVYKFAENYSRPVDALTLMAELYAEDIQNMDHYEDGRFVFHRLASSFNEFMGLDSYRINEEPHEFTDLDVEKLRDVKSKFGSLSRLDAYSVAQLLKMPDWTERLDVATKLIGADPSISDPIGRDANNVFLQLGDRPDSLHFARETLLDPSIQELLHGNPLLEKRRYQIMQLCLQNTELNSKESLQTILEAEELLNLIDENSPAYFMAEVIIQEAFLDEDPMSVLKKYNTLFKDADNIWKITSTVTLDRYDHARFTGRPTATLTRLPISLPSSTEATYHPDAIVYADGDEALDFLRLAGASEQVLENYQQFGEVNLSDLPEAVVQAVLVANIYESITMSRNIDLRHQATERNRSVTAEEVMRAGNYSHATPSSVLSLIIQNGCLPGEFILANSQEDSTPLAADFVELDYADTFEEAINAGNQGYGGVRLIFQRGANSHRDGEEYHAGLVTNRHYVIAGGLPSTEIIGMSIDESKVDTEEIKRLLLENDIFIPVFSTSGEPIFSYEEYQEARRDGNYDAVRPRNVDGAVRVPDSQKGSNEGALFLFPARDGAEARQYYVKFSTPESQYHLWNELLTDAIYREVDSGLVPVTEAVFIDGRMARASQVAEADDQPVTNEARNRGFVLDAFVGNWDAVFNSANLHMSGGVAMRIDTGNSLFYRARGGMKEDDQFSGKVTELEIGDNVEDLGVGMRQMYPDLSTEDISAQAEALSKRLTDEKIEELVNGTRLPSSYREKVIEILKQRRDYIVSWAEQQAAR